MAGFLGGVLGAVVAGVGSLAVEGLARRILPAVSWVDGGFFRYASGRDWTRPGFRAVAPVNAPLS